MGTKALTDRSVRSIMKQAAIAKKHGKPGQAIDYFDAYGPQGFGLRLTANWHANWMLLERYPASPNRYPTRRTLGDVFLPKEGTQPLAKIEHGALTLAEAREKARRWIDMIARGIDPKVEADRERIAALQKQANSVSAVVKDYLARPDTKALAKYADCEKCLNDFAKRCGIRPITEITSHDVTAAIKAVMARGAVYQAHNFAGYVKRLFNWAIGTQEYGLTGSPMQHLDLKDLIGKRELRNRVLTDSELREVWEAAGELGYPYGPLVRTLILTGQREREIADMSWGEIDFDKALLTIPAKRMKGDRAHEVQLAPDALVILKDLDKLRSEPPEPSREKLPPGRVLPLWDKGNFVFSGSRGESAVDGFAKAKARLDKLVAQKRATARLGEGAEPEEQDFISPGWVFHDLRRTARTHFSALPVQDIVRELVIAHAKPGLHRVYDQHAYQAEKRECLELWEQRLKKIVTPRPPAEVTTLDSERSTLLIDEADSFVTSKDELRGIINSGHARDYAFVIRCVGDDAEPQRFSTWAAIAFGSIGKLQATIEDRSVSIPLRRRMPGEQIAKLPRNGTKDLSGIRARCARWVQDHREELLAADPNIPDGLNDRAADNWRLMIAVADLASADWPKRARTGALELSGPGAIEDDSARVQLLADLRDIFAAEERDQLTSECLVECLVGLEDRPWPEWGKGAKPLTKRQLARLLNPFDIRPCNIWVGDRPLKGYKRGDFEDAFARYLSSPPTARPLEPARNSGPTAASDALGIPLPSVSTNAEKLRRDGISSGLADHKPAIARSGRRFEYVDDPDEVIIRHGRLQRS